jgi:hypothetical protein
MPLVLFLFAWFIFTFGPGIAITGRLTRHLDPLRRVVVALGAGTAAAPVLINFLGRLHGVSLFPIVAVALTAAGVWVSRGSTSAATPSSVESPWGDAIACAGLVALAVTLGYIVFAHRMEVTPAGIVLYGDYDTADLSYYAVEASEASHTIPPMASYYSGHQLNAAYFPHLVPAMIHRFAGVPILAIYFQFAWPTFLALSALTAFILVRSIASRTMATLAVTLMLVGSDLSYLAVWFFPEVQRSGAWDFVLWPTNFLSPTMQLLHFSTWGPSLPLFFTVLYTIVLGLKTRGRGWIVVSALLLGVLFEFKPFAYVILMAGLGAASIFAGRDRVARWHFAATAALSVVFALPFLIAAATLDPGDRRTHLVVEFLPLVKRMLIKLGVTDALATGLPSLAGWPALRGALLLLIASTVFFAVGIGVRWVGLGGVWRAIVRRFDADVSAWSLLGWSVVASIAIPIVIATDPYVDTLQFYVPGLFLLWIFTASALVKFARRYGAPAIAVSAVAVALTLPSSTHYLERRWTDRQRPARVDLSASEIRIAEYLRNKTDPETTVVLHDRPLSPSLTAVVAERRIVLGWDVTYSAVGGQERLRDVNRFFSSAEGNPDAAFESLARYHVTHVIVRDDDRVHPAVLARLRMLMQFPGAALYIVPETP